MTAREAYLTKRTVEVDKTYPAGTDLLNMVRDLVTHMTSKAVS